MLHSVPTDVKNLAPSAAAGLVAGSRARARRRLEGKGGKRGGGLLRLQAKATTGGAKALWGRGTRACDVVAGGRVRVGEEGWSWKLGIRSVIDFFDACEAVSRVNGVLSLLCD